MENLILLSVGDFSCEIYKGELVGINYLEEQYMHGGGKPVSIKEDNDKLGWGHSEIVMFPIIGPVKGFNLEWDQNLVPMDGHGMSRNMTWKLVERGSDFVLFKQEYEAGNLILNAKYKEGGKNPKHLSWPFSFVLRKKIQLLDKEVVVKIEVENKSFFSMPYMLGYHPAFRFLGDFDEGKIAVFSKEMGKKEYSLSEVVNESSLNLAVKLDNVSFVSYTNKDKKILVCFEDFGKGMLGCSGKEAGMFFIEPVTYLLNVSKSDLYLQDPSLLRLSPGERKSFLVSFKVS